MHPNVAGARTFVRSQGQGLNEFSGLLVLGLIEKLTRGRWNLLVDRLPRGSSSLKAVGFDSVLMFGVSQVPRCDRF